MKWVRFAPARFAAWGHPFRAGVVSPYLDENMCGVRRFGCEVERMNRLQRVED
jgi:hypothetical protein